MENGKCYECEHCGLRWIHSEKMCYECGTDEGVVIKDIEPGEEFNETLED